MAAEAQYQSASAADDAGKSKMIGLVVFLFFSWGLITNLNDALIPKLKGLFELNYTEAMLTQFAFFLGYFVFSVPSGLLLAKLGYVRGIVVGLLVMMSGCLLFAPAAMSGVYPGFLGALFIVAAGITMLQVAANPYIALVGDSGRSHSRLTLAQAFNSLGTTVGPFIGAIFILRGGVEAPKAADAAALAAARVAEAEYLLQPFLVIAGVLALISLLFWLRRRAPGPTARAASVHPFRREVLSQRRLMLGVGAIFLYVGAEVAIGSGLTNYLMQDSVIGGEAQAIGRWAGQLLIPFGGHSAVFNVAQVAGAMVSIYWGLAMIGRFVGSYVLARVTAGRVLAFNALAAMTLAIVSSLTSGVVAAASVLAIGLANSVMFPTIFTLALEGLGAEVPNGSALLCMAIVGGALVPVAYGAMADFAGLAFALLVPAACYVLIAAYGLMTANESKALAAGEALIDTSD